MLPKKYAWLAGEPGPKMLLEALKVHGVIEGAGEKDNPTLLAWANEVGEKGFKHDSTAWCGLAMAVCAKRAGWAYKPKGNALWARNWASWGNPAKVAMLGDILVFPRGQGGHVAIYVGEDLDYYHILGGNQDNVMSIKRRAKKPLLAIRRAPWRVAQPANVRTVKMAADGPISKSEA